MFSKFFDLFFAGLRKDLLNAMSYRIQFFGAYLLIFFNLTIYFFFLEFIRPQGLSADNTDYFKYLFIGLMMIDFSMVMARSLSGPITTYKNQGIFEELMSLPMPEIYIILNSAPFAIFSGLVRLGCFSIFYILVYGYEPINLLAAFYSVVSIIFFIICSLGISLIFSSVTLIFHRGEGLPFAYTAVSTLLGGVFYPVEVISEKLIPLSDILPIKHLLEILRGLHGVNDYTDDRFFYNIILLFFLALLSTFVGKIMFKKALLKAKKRGNLYIY